MTEKEALNILKTITDALEKQIPKKVIYNPKHIPWDIHGTNDYGCPMCGEDVWFCKWCPECGQRLEWK